MTKVVAMEAANDGITCNAICPGWVLTPLVQQQIEARAKAAGQIGQASGGGADFGKTADAQFTKPEKHRRARRVSDQRRRRHHHRLGLFDRRRLDGAVIAPR